MMLNPTIVAINRLFQSQKINIEIVNIERMKGTTDGLVFRLESCKNKKYILKYDSPNNIQLVEQLLNTYNESLLPEILYVHPDKSYFIYYYIDGRTHFDRGKKKDWLTVLIQEIFNKYIKYQDSDKWGRIEYPCDSWKEFNDISIEEAKDNIRNNLAEEDYLFVKSLSNTLFEKDKEQGDRFLLHGDTGVHNFVYDQSKLVGVIDPSPMVGPLIYDFIYAFCSSSDDLNMETLFTAYDQLEQGLIDRKRLIDEVTIQLYCRIGLSVKHDLDNVTEYLKAWKEWKEFS
ncbi:thiamine kinase-like enzyme [Paenibacillus sp. DS2015]|uniref:phosphotransferase n=1 Tax=Paenibacillus sp. DS2015 TaxID=3373917 RepID=UPI003D1CD01B